GLGLELDGGRGHGRGLSKAHAILCISGQVPTRHICTKVQHAPSLPRRGRVDARDARGRVGAFAPAPPPPPPTALGTRPPRGRAGPPPGGGGGGGVPPRHGPPAPPRDARAGARVRRTPPPPRGWRPAGRGEANGRSARAFSPRPGSRRPRAPARSARPSRTGR